MVNGAQVTLPIARATPLRNDLRLNGPKVGCGLGECGAGAVLLDGRAARSCVVSAGAAYGLSNNAVLTTAQKVPLSAANFRLV